MFDARYFAYATISAVLVISPGATMAVVMETAIGEGRLAALYTVLGINIGNSTLALTSALGMSIVFHQWPWTMEAVKVGGAGYCWRTSGCAACSLRSRAGGETNSLGPANPPNSPNPPNPPNSPNPPKSINNSTNQEINN